MILQRLRERGILGLNARNAELIGRYNPIAHFANVDDKVTAKQLASAAGLPVPLTYRALRHYGDVARLSSLLPKTPSFVLKPVRGSMGNGILVVQERQGDRFVHVSGRVVMLNDLRHHIANTLAGMHSLGGRADHVLIEERLEVHPALAAVAKDGVPDVRLIIFRGVPVMAMLRLPTARSEGRANLHRGALAVGVDLRTGLTTRAMLGGQRVRQHPDTGAALEGVVVPHWEEMLEMAARGGEAFGLGYLGLDLVADARRGPVFLEANARPGLAIQLANGRGLEPRLRAVEQQKLDGVAARERVELGKSLAE